MKLLRGDCLDVLRTLPDGSVHCVVTSPPYWGLRDYGTAQWRGGDPNCDHIELKARKPTERRSSTLEECRRCGARRVDRQLGLERTPADYLAKMVAVFREVKRVLRDDGTCWVNMGDSYGSGTRATRDYSKTTKHGYWNNPGIDKRIPSPAKQLLGMPWRLAFALQADGWYLRSDIIWHKPNPMPESVTDRPTKSHEYLFLLSKRAKYFYDAEAVREASLQPRGLAQRTGQHKLYHKREGMTLGANYGPAHRNLRTVWTIASQPYREAHFAVYPEKLVEPCVKAGTSERGCCPKCGGPWERITKPTVETSLALEAARNGQDWYARNRDNGTKRSRAKSGHKAEGGYISVYETIGWQPTCDCNAGDPVPCTVLDPFAGSGTTGAVALKLGREFLGIELNADYCQLAEKRIGKAQKEMALPLLEGAV